MASFTVRPSKLMSSSTPPDFIIVFELHPDEVSGLLNQVASIYGDLEVHLSRLCDTGPMSNHWLFVDKNRDVAKQDALLHWLKSLASNSMQTEKISRLGSSMTFDVGLPSKSASCSAIARKRPDYVL